MFCVYLESFHYNIDKSLLISGDSLVSAPPGDDSLSDLSGFTHISMESPSAGSLLITPEAGSGSARTPIIPSSRTCRQLKISPNTSTPQETRFRQRRSLGDFILPCDNDSGRKKKSPHSETTSRRTFRKRNTTPVQKFSITNLDDFPTLGGVETSPVETR